MLHGEVMLAKRLKADGVHLRSDQFDQILTAKRAKLFTVISCHSIEEVKRAQKLGADAVTYSPIFATPGKGKPLGVERLKYLLKRVKIKVIALGGIVGEKQLEALERVRPYGFASIRYFALAKEPRRR